MGDSRTFSVECRLECLAGLASEARRLAEPAVGRPSATLLDTAITEICSNIVRHGHAGDPEHRYSVRVSALADEVEVEIRDEGPAFSFAGRAMPSVDVAIDDLPEGGFGMAIVAATMDVFEQRREDGVNITRLVKRRS